METVKELQVKRLICCCCGKSTRGRQWHNRDKGYGLCLKCHDWISTKETKEEMDSCYGVKGVHCGME